MILKKTALLKDIFISLCRKFSAKTSVIEELWAEIFTLYNQKNRFYHNLKHVKNVLYEIKETRKLVSDFDTILLSAFYHDIIYDPTKNNNEEQSAIFAKKSLKKLNSNSEIIEKCTNQILATKKHKSEDNDTLHLIDADLSIFGKSEEVYREYTVNIRKEYSFLSDEEYKKGRTKVIQYFL